MPRPPDTNPREPNVTTPPTNQPATPATATTREYVLRYATDRGVWNLHRPDGTVMMTLPDANTGPTTAPPGPSRTPGATPASTSTTCTA